MEQTRMNERVWNCVGRRLGWLGAAVAGAIGVLLGGCESAPAPKHPTAAVPAGSYAFWPQFPDEPRVQFLRAFTGSNDLSPPSSSGLEKLVFGKENAGDSMGINKPYGVAAKDGKIYVCDIRSSCLIVLDLAKKQTRLVGASGTNRLEHPVDVAVADDGTLYVADNNRGAILVFDASERYVRPIGHEKGKPVSVAVHGDRLYACDMPSQTVEIYSRADGKKTGSFGTVGDEDGQFRLPLAVRTDRAGNVYVVDMMRCRVQKFDADGKFISGVGQLGDYAGSFARPKHMAVDSEGIMYVVDASFQNVQMFNDKFELLMAFGAAGDFPGSMNLPVGICVTDQGLEYFKDQVHPGFEAKRLVIVTNQFGPAKVAVYALGQRRPSYALADMASSYIKVAAGVDTAPEKREIAPVASDTEPEGGSADAEAPSEPAPAAPKGPAPTPAKPAKPDAPR